MKGKWTQMLPYVFMALVALSRWPGLFGSNFSAMYALCFCAGAFFPGNSKWWLPLATALLSDIGLAFYYHSWSAWQLVTYAAFAVIVWLGTRFNRRSSFLGLLLGGIFGALLFYLITNTASWLANPTQSPEYTRDLAGWIVALTKGIGGYPTTLHFFLNTLLSGGLFTGLFAGAMKLTAAAESAREKEPQEQEEQEPEGEPAPAPDEAKA